MMKICRNILVLLALMALTGCAANYSKQQVLASGSQVQVRSYQTRTYDTDDKIRVLRAVMSTLQDLGFVIDKADDVIGIVSATKLNRYNLSMSISVRPSGQQMIVRANAQYNLTAVEEPGPYQDFFTSLDKGLFLDDNLLTNSKSTQNIRVEASKNLADDIGDDAFAFYGQAEKEIVSGTYDANLWAKAFVLVEGDEQKRKAKYIELRAYQLYNQSDEASAAEKPVNRAAIKAEPIVPIVVNPSNSADDISGIWKSNITSGEIKNRNRVITFKQVGNTISGTWDTDPFHKITGVREGDTIKFNWIEGSATDKEGKWKISPDGFRMEGRWTRNDGIRSGKFDLEKIQ
ncbi:MAG: hypothetical protein ACERLB_03735 [Gammaproteobacteria bacterium]